MEDPRTIKLGDLCRSVGVSERDARYALERGHVPPGIDEKPESGNHRRFPPGPAFWLAMVLKLKASGVKTPLAARIAEYAEGALRGVTQSLNWEATFRPSAGLFATDRRYYVDVGDLEFIRFVTDAGPGDDGRLTEFDWSRIARPGHPVADARPCAIIRLDLSEIARRLGAAFESAADG